ncbi:SPOSA6832_02352, partial [Sporobolomyces salmonicolor]
MSNLTVPPIPPYTSLKAPPRLTPSISQCTSTLSSLYRITVPSSSRQFIGTFVCIDPQGNLVLDQTTEWEVDLDEEGNVTGRKGEARDVGLVMVPRKWWGRIERLRTEEERAAEFEQRRGTQGCAPS